MYVCVYSSEKKMDTVGDIADQTIICYILFSLYNKLLLEYKNPAYNSFSYLLCPYFAQK